MYLGIFSYDFAVSQVTPYSQTFLASTLVLILTFFSRCFIGNQEKNNFICCLKYTGQLLINFCKPSFLKLHTKFFFYLLYLMFAWHVWHAIWHVYLPEISVHMTYTRKNLVNKVVFALLVTSCQLVRTTCNKLYGIIRPVTSCSNKSDTVMIQQDVTRLTQHKAVAILLYYCNSLVGTTL